MATNSQPAGPRAICLQCTSHLLRFTRDTGGLRGITPLPARAGAYSACSCLYCLNLSVLPYR